jgi:hypothetical protein
MAGFEQGLGMVSLCLLAVMLIGLASLAIASIPDVKRYFRIRRM